MQLNEHYYWNLARAFIIQELNLDESYSDDELYEKAKEFELKIHFLKRLLNPRMKKSCSLIKSIWPESLLDIGAGKAYLMGHIHEQLHDTLYHCLDISTMRINRLQKVILASDLKYQATCADASKLPFDSKSFTCVSMFEILEHTTNPHTIVGEAIRVSHKYCLLSVPSKEDDNPEHIQLFNRNSLMSLFEVNGINHKNASISIEQDSAHFYMQVRFHD